MSAAGLVAALTRRLTVRDVLRASAAGLFAGALVLVAAEPVAERRSAIGTAIAVTLAVVGVGLWRGRGSWPSETVAAWAEARCGGLDNLLVTAMAGPALAVASPAIRAEVVRQADERVTALNATTLVPLTGAAGGVLIAAALAAAAVAWTQRPAAVPTLSGEPGSATVTDGFVVAATVTPPAYLKRPPVTLDDPTEVRVPAGGSVRLVVRTGLGGAILDDPEGGAVPLVAGAELGTFERTWVPTQSTTGAIVGLADGGTTRGSRLLAIVVAPDQRPLVRVVRPGQDLRLASGAATIELEVEATDDYAVSSLELRYVRMSGGGESFTFGEGRVPIRNLTPAPGGLRGHLSWSLRPLALDAGEALVYRVVARDDAPGAPPGESESYTIDIGGAFETSGAGAAVAEEDRRYAISQQMVIVHTEGALAERATVAADAWLTRLQGIAAEQRMVRAEVVFLSGGEVQDEVEEAARGDEVQEGRLENRGRAEMQRALGEMSRAEARLTAGDARGALVFERQALAALLKAFDRRRYFLRTMPEKSRIDLTRRLSGDLRTAAPGPRVPPTAPDRLAPERALLLALATADPARPLPPSLATRVAALAPGDPRWRQRGARLLAASDDAARRVAVSEVATALWERVGALLPASSDGAGSRRLLDGLWTEEQRLAGSAR
ncbi:MAG: DUF4175 family protein [Acidobacteriota bacterium]